MNATLLIALFAGLPLAGVSWLAAATVERLGAGVRLRLAAWTVAFVLPIALAPAALLIDAMDIHSPLAAAADFSSLPFIGTEKPRSGQAEDVLRDSPTPAASPSVPAHKGEEDGRVAVASAHAPTALSFSLSWAQMVLAILALVAAIRLAILALALQRVSRLVAASEPIEGAGYGGAAPVRQSDHDTPVLAGLRRPVVLLPRKLVASLTPAQAALICAHEQAHLAAGDHVAHLIEEAALRLFWFNPVLGLIRAALSAAREEACDARALAASDGSTRRAYAESLLAALRLAGDAEPIAAFTGLGHHDAARRLLAILHPRAGVSAPAVAAAGLLAVCLAATTGGLSLALAAQPLAREIASSVQTIRQSQTFTAAAAEQGAAPASVSTTVRGAAENQPALQAAPSESAASGQATAQTFRTADGSPAPTSSSKTFRTPLSSIHVQGGGLVFLRHGETASVQTTSRRTILVDADGNMTIGPCESEDCPAVNVVSPRVPTLSVQGATINVDEGFPDQAEAMADIKEGGLINLMAVRVKTGSAAIKNGGQIMIQSSDKLTANVKGGGNIVYLGAPRVNSAVQDGGVVFGIGE